MGRQEGERLPHRFSQYLQAWAYTYIYEKDGHPFWANKTGFKLFTSKPKTRYAQ